MVLDSESELVAWTADLSFGDSVDICSSICRNVTLELGFGAQTRVEEDRLRKFSSRKLCKITRLNTADSCFVN